MNPQGTPTGQDFLSRELNESQTDEARKSETLRLLHEAKEIQARFPDNPEIAKEYEELRNATILSLQDLQADLRDEILGIRLELEGREIDSLSEGEINIEEFGKIQEESEELEAVERSALQEKFGDTLEETGTLMRYGVLQSILWIPEISNEVITQLTNELRENGNISFSTLTELNNTFSSISSFDEIQNSESIIMVINAIETGNFQQIEEAGIEPEILLGAFRNTVDNNPQLIEKILFEIDIKEDIFGGYCSPQAVIYIDYLRAAFQNEKQIHMRQNIEAYYINQDISPDSLEGIDTLIERLSTGGCNIEYIVEIRAFNEANNLDISFSEEDAQSILGSTIELRRTENEIELLYLGDEITQITGLSFDEIQAAIESGDPQTIGEFLDPYHENNPRITDIEGEIFELLDVQRDIETQEMLLDRIVSESPYIYGLEPHLVEREKQKAIHSFQTVDSSVAFIHGLEEFTWTQENIDYVRENPESRISEIKNEDLLLRYFDRYPEDFDSKVRLYDLYPPLLSSVNVITSFPGEIGVDDLSFISYDLFSENPQAIESLLLGDNFTRNLITYFSQSNDTIGSLHQALLNIKQAYPNHDVFGELNNTIIQYDRENGSRLSIFTPVEGEYYENSQEELEQKISENGFENHIGEIDIYLQSHPDGFLHIDGRLLSQERAYNFLIEAGYFGGLRGLHWNPNIAQSTVSKIIMSDIGSTRFIAKNKMGEQQNIETLVREIEISENPSDNLYALRYINLVGEDGTIDTRMAIDIAVIVQEKLGAVMQESEININGSFLNVIAGTLENISDEDTAYILSDRKKFETFQILTGLLELRQTAREIKQEALEASENGGRLELTSTFIHESSISENGKEQLLRELISNRQISQEIMNILIAEFGNNPEELHRFIGGLRENLLRDGENNRRLLEETEFRLQEIPAGLRDFVIENGENDTFLLNPASIQIAFNQFIEGLSETEQNLTPIEKRQLFLNFIRGDINPDNTVYETIAEWIITSEELTVLQEQSVEEIILHGTNGILDIHNNQIRERFYRGEIFYTPPSQEGNIENTPTTLSPENISSPDLRDQYREITTELNLSPEEAKSLTEEELTLISTNEEAKENFIGFRQTLVDLNLEDIWQFRKQIFRSIGSLDFNTTDGNYIGENELNIFLSKVVYAITRDERLQSTPSNLDTTTHIIRTINRSEGFTGQEDVNLEGGSIIETSFREQFAPRNEGLIGFKVGAFLEAIKQ